MTYTKVAYCDFEIKPHRFEKSLTIYKKDEPEFSIFIKKGFWFFFDNKVIPLNGHLKAN